MFGGILGSLHYLRDNHDLLHDESGTTKSISKKSQLMTFLIITSIFGILLWVIAR